MTAFSLIVYFGDGPCSERESICKVDPMGVVAYRDFVGLKVFRQLLLALPLKSQLVNSRLVRFTKDDTFDRQT